jgi:lipid-A-disaccharide synthase
MVMSCSGTATLEVALLGIPLLIVYKLSPLTYLLGKYLIHTPFIGLPNIIAGQKIVTEWIQHQANPKNLTQEMQRILTDSLYAQTMREQLQQLKKQLGESGASDQVALLALEMLNLSDSNSNHYLF